MIRVKVNGEARVLSGETVLTELLRELSLSEKRIAVELNGSVIGREDWPRTIVANGDIVEVVHFVGGG